MDGNKARGVQLVATTMLNPPANAGAAAGAARRPHARAAGRSSIGADRSTTSCASRVTATTDSARRSRSSPRTMAPPLAGSPRVNGHRDYIIKVVLHGLTGPGRRQDLHRRDDSDGQPATTSGSPRSRSYVRNSFGNSGGFITPADVARVRAATAGRKTLWTLPELDASLPVGALHGRLEADGEPQPGRGRRRADASPAWNAGAPQQAGMWFQVELPKPEMVTEIQFQSPPPGGRGGAGNAAAVSASGAPVAAPGGFPRGYKVEISQDGSSWTPASRGDRHTAPRPSARSSRSRRSSSGSA